MKPTDKKEIKQLYVYKDDAIKIQVEALKRNITASEVVKELIEKSSIFKITK